MQTTSPRPLSSSQSSSSALSSSSAELSFATRQQHQQRSSPVASRHAQHPPLTPLKTSKVRHDAYSPKNSEGVQDTDAVSPLFDPSGLSSSISSDSPAGWGSFDLDSVAAKRLGISPPMGRSSSASQELPAAPLPLAVDASSGDSQTLPAQSLEEGVDTDGHQRGRRRRTSAEEEGKPDTAQWWMRSRAQPETSVDADSEETGDTSIKIRDLAHDSASTRAARVRGEESNSPSASRSPAAEFLSAFSRANSVIKSPATASSASPNDVPRGRTWRPSWGAPSASTSRSPLGDKSASNSYQVLGTAASEILGGQRTSGWPFANSPDATSHKRVLSGSAAEGSWNAPVPPSHRGEPGGSDQREQLGYGSRHRGVSLGGVDLTPASPGRPDDEGARIGPEGRYMVGKVIAFGGFSTVREAFDVKNEEIDRAHGISSAAERRRVAVKLIYSDQSSNFGIGGRNKHAKVEGLNKDQILKEMALWRDLPIHENILPLIWHERISLDPSAEESHEEPRVHGPSEAAAVDVLVMPLCDRGSLLDFVRNEGKSSASGSTFTPTRPVGVPLSRTSTMQSDSDKSATGGVSTLAPIVQGVADSQTTASPSATAPAAGRVGLSRAASLSVHLPSGGNRAGLPTPSGSSSLHAVLGGSTLASAFNSPAGSVGPSSASGSFANTGSLRRVSSKRSTARSRGVPIAVAKDVMLQIARGLQVLHEKAGVLHADLKLENVIGQARRPDAESTEVQWRIADFGLAIQVDEESFAEARRDKTVPRGGSLAYTAPEALRDSPSPGLEEQPANFASPFAADMWAAGCIMYALFTGKLPFSDPFEPRLQSKIIKGEWDMPARLRRRGQTGPLSPSNSMIFSQKDRSQSFAAPSSFSGGTLGRASSVGHRFIGRPGLDAMRAETYAPLGKAEQSFDLSQSLSSLPAPLASREFLVGPAMDSTWKADTSPTDGTESEADAESDSEASSDQPWNGTSLQRVWIRKALRGLLEPEPSKRWDVNKLLTCEWLRTSEADLVAKEPEKPLSFEREETSEERGRSRAPDKPRESSLSRSRPPHHRLANGSDSPSTMPAGTNQEIRSSTDADLPIRRGVRGAGAARSRSAGRKPAAIDTSYDQAALPGWPRSIIEQARVDSPGLERGRRPLKAQGSRDSLHFRGFMPVSGTSSPAYPASATHAEASSPRVSTPIAIESRSGSRGSQRSSSVNRVARSLHDDYGRDSPGIFHENVTRRSTSRSRTRAPDALASILDRERSRERPIAESVNDDDDTHADVSGEADEADEMDRDRGRARSRARRG